MLQIDYINLTYTSSGMDVYEMREFLDEHNGENIKIIAKVRQQDCMRLSQLRQNPLYVGCPYVLCQGRASLLIGTGIIMHDG